ncbi:uncharacterized protein [Blastocystis hominis]|uniref:Uncharacterized protein n=1 Tax=Blastocystis hominis TaxID=12968 RepID=D8M7K4_BLAHO|nr:uncharacterized protein [Blastocystis hominis]CBK24043.2 unnamed protein product [Blastocystis hominis]|eukprot:XP_012898091.1 uncharacterized protein [Blastocystis hominis]
MVPNLPGLRAPQAPARREPHFLLLRTENRQRRERRSLPNDPHAPHPPFFPEQRIARSHAPRARVPPHRRAVPSVPRLRAGGPADDRVVGRPVERADFPLLHVVAHRGDAREDAERGRVVGASVAERAGEGVAVLVLQRGVRVEVDVEAKEGCEVG